jgi:hypothetical protein
MNGVHQAVRQRCKGALVTTCRCGRCRLETGDLDRDRLTIVDVDRHLPDPPEGTKKPDYYVLVSNDGVYVVVVEMKDGRGQASNVDQIRAGAEQVAELLSGFPDVRFLPLLVSQSMNAIERRALDRKKVVFRGKRFSVVTCRCGTRLSKHL